MAEAISAEVTPPGWAARAFAISLATSWVVTPGCAARACLNGACHFLRGDSRLHLHSRNRARHYAFDVDGRRRGWRFGFI